MHHAIHLESPRFQMYWNLKRCLVECKNDNIPLQTSTTNKFARNRRWCLQVSRFFGLNIWSLQLKMHITRDSMQALIQLAACQQARKPSILVPFISSYKQPSLIIQGQSKFFPVWNQTYNLLKQCEAHCYVSFSFCNWLNYLWCVYAPVSWS